VTPLRILCRVFRRYAKGEEKNNLSVRLGERTSETEDCPLAQFAKDHRRFVLLVARRFVLMQKKPGRFYPARSIVFGSGGDSGPVTG